MIHRASRRRAASVVGTVVAAGFFSPAVHAQIGPPIGTNFPVTSDSGSHDNPGNEPAVVFTAVVEVPGTAFIRLFFAEANLPPGSSLRLTSVFDGAVQDLDAAALSQWQLSSAFFNGPAVQIDLIAGPNTTGNRFVVNGAFASIQVIEPLTLCGADDRVPSNHPAVSRLMPSTCSASIYAPGGCMLSAGHCAPPNDMVEFNVPPSLPSGTIQHPPPSDQYMIDPASRVFEYTPGQSPPMDTAIGADWFHFRCLPNTQTGLTVIEAQQAYIPLADALPTSFPQPIVIYGYGTDSDTPQNNEVQQRSDGPLIGFWMTPNTTHPSLRHQADTTGGSSGSPILEASTGRAVGIHTNGGCTGPNMSNGGTPITYVNLQAALSCPLLVFAYPYGVVTQINPAGGATLHVSIDVVVGTMQADSAELHLRIGNGPFATLPMDLEGTDFVATLPAVACSGQMQYYVSASATDGTLFTDPFPAPAMVHTAVCTYGDSNLDSYVDLTDYAALAMCWSGPTTAQPQASCMAFRFDADEDIDLADVRAFLSAVAGP